MIEVVATVEHWARLAGLPESALVGLRSADPAEVARAADRVSALARRTAGGARDPLPVALAAASAALAAWAARESRRRRG